MESHWHELLDIESELTHIRGAAKVSLTELEKDMGYLRSGLDCVNREVEFQRGLQKMEAGDRFLPSVREFLSGAVCRIQELEDLFADMKGSFAKTVSLFGEEYREIDEFFSIFDQFLAGFADARAENEVRILLFQLLMKPYTLQITNPMLFGSYCLLISKSVRKRREDEEKRAQDATLRRVVGGERVGVGGTGLGSRDRRDMSGGAGGQATAAPGEFDDLISALRTGEWSEPKDHGSLILSLKFDNHAIIFTFFARRRRVHGGRANVQAKPRFPSAPQPSPP